MMALAVCVLAIFGCSKSSDPYTPGQSDIDIYNMRFMSYVGWSINDNQDWGFDASNKTKSATRGEENGYFITDKYEKEYTKSYFKQAFDSLPEGQKVAEKIRKNFEFISRGPFRFDIVFSSTKEEFEIGYYYYNPKSAFSLSPILLGSTLSSEIIFRMISVSCLLSFVSHWFCFT